MIRLFLSRPDSALILFGLAAICSQTAAQDIAKESKDYLSCEVNLTPTWPPFEIKAQPSDVWTRLWKFSADAIANKDEQPLHFQVETPKLVNDCPTFTVTLCGHLCDSTASENLAANCQCPSSLSATDGCDASCAATCTECGKEASKITTAKISDQTRLTSTVATESNAEDLPSCIEKSSAAPMPMLNFKRVSSDVPSQADVVTLQPPVTNESINTDKVEKLTAAYFGAMAKATYFEKLSEIQNAHHEEVKQLMNANAELMIRVAASEATQSLMHDVVQLTLENVALESQLANAREKIAQQIASREIASQNAIAQQLTANAELAKQQNVGGKPVPFARSVYVPLYPHFHLSDASEQKAATLASEASKSVCGNVCGCENECGCEATTASASSDETCCGCEDQNCKCPSVTTTEESVTRSAKLENAQY